VQHLCVPLCLHCCQVPANVMLHLYLSRLLSLLGRLANCLIYSSFADRVAGSGGAVAVAYVNKYCWLGCGALWLVLRLINFCITPNHKTASAANLRILRPADIAEHSLCRTRTCLGSISVPKWTKISPAVRQHIK
jgi:hypothetical protein